MVIIGDKIGKLQVVKLTKRVNYQVYYECLCDCGTIKEIAGRHLINTSKGTRSCGCLYEEMESPRKLPKGEAGFNDWYGKFIRDAEKRGKVNSLSKEEVLDLTKGNCHYCGTIPHKVFLKGRYNGDFIYNGIDRVDNSKGYIKENVVTCCKMCNIAKSTYTVSEFKDWIVRAYNYSKLG